MPRSRRVLAIVGDTQVGLWVVRSLGRHGLTVFSVCASHRGLAAHSKYSCGAWAIESSPTSPAFLDEVESLARELDVGSIMTIAEGYHQALIAGRDRFEPDIRVLSPPAEAFAKATDKHFMHGLCERLGVPVAKGTTLDRLMEAGGDGLQFPLVMRTSRQNDRQAKGHAPWKAAYAENQTQLEDLYRSVQDFADNVLVQEYHPGVEDYVQVLMHEGEAFMVGEYLGEHHMPLAGGVTVQRITCRHEPVVRRRGPAAEGHRLGRHRRRAVPLRSGHGQVHLPGDQPAVHRRPAHDHHGRLPCSVPVVAEPFRAGEDASPRITAWACERASSAATPTGCSGCSAATPCRRDKNI